MLDELNEIKVDFDSAIDRIKKYIDMFDMINNIDVQYMKKSKFYKSVDKQLRELKTGIAEIRLVRHNAIIVSLYGCYELAIKSATKAVIRHMIKYGVGEVDKLKNENLNAVARALERTEKSQVGDLIRGLDLLYNQDDLTGYNYDLALNTFQNLKTKPVYELAKVIGINNLEQQIRTSRQVIDYVKETQGISTDDKAIEYINSGVSIFGDIDILVDSRNKIAHEGYEPQMVSDTIILEQYIPTLSVFVNTYIRLLQTELLKLHKGEQDKFYEIKLIRPVIDNHIICFNTENNRVNKKSIIFVATESNYFLAQILKIQFNKNDIEESEENQDIGCCLDINVKSSYSLYLLTNNE